MICDVIWCSTTPEGAAMVWAAVIAAIPAIGAIVGAFIIGRRQLKLLDYQAALQGEIGLRAASIEKLKVKVDLFDRRMEVYEAVEAFVHAIVRDGRSPNHRRKGEKRSDRDIEITRDFIESMTRARFLFEDGVRDVIWNEVWLKSNDLSNHQVSQDYPQPQPGDETDHVQAETDLLIYFGSMRIEELFKGQLDLSAD